MTEKLYYWAENLEGYSSDNDAETNYDEVIEIKRLNFFIGKNNAGKSRFLREIFISPLSFSDFNYIEPMPYLETLKNKANDIYPRNFGFQNGYGGNLKESFLDKVNLLIQERHSTSITKFKKILDNNLKELSKFHITENPTEFSAILSTYDEKHQSFLKENSFDKKFYIPIFTRHAPCI